mgnify:CR=1 FL=1
MEDIELAEVLTLREQRRRAKMYACLSSFYEFYLTFWFCLSGDEFINNWHIKYLCGELQTLGQRLFRREKGIEDLIINLPPGMSKSTMLASFVVWIWLHAPHFRYIGSSYSLGLAIDNSLRAKSIVKSEMFAELFQHYFVRRFGRVFDLTKDNENDWRNTYGGGYYATSTGGSVQGKHAHLIGRDDPINPEQAESKAYRDRCNRYNDRTLAGRKIDKDRVPTITIMQRLHEDDTTGHELKKTTKLIRHICLPAILTDDVKPEAVRAYYHNGLLDKNRLSEATLEKMRTDFGAYGFAGQFLQSPIKAGGNMIKTDWFGRFALTDLNKASGHGGLVWNFTIDGAYTEKDEGDASAIMAYCTWNNNLYIRDVAAVRMEMPELLKFLPDFVERNGYSRKSRIYIEPKASGLSVAQMMKKNTSLNIVIDDPPKGSKVQRVVESLPFLESGRCYLLDGGSFITAFLEELKIFPLSDHDDQVDTLTMAVRRATKSKGINITDLSGFIP